VRIVDTEGHVVQATKQLTGYHGYKAVREAIVLALLKMHIALPNYLIV
jgi:hypothetical protein